MAYRVVPKPEPRLGKISDREILLRQKLASYGLRFNRTDDIVKNFHQYWKGQINAIELFKACKMRSFQSFKRLLGEYL